MKHFLKETDFTASELPALLALAREFKMNRGRHVQPLARQTWAMIFSKSSTRTRVSFETVRPAASASAEPDSAAITQAATTVT